MKFFGFMVVIQIVLVILRLANQIDWSWGIVLIPLYVILFILLFFVGLAKLIWR